MDTFYDEDVCNTIFHYISAVPRLRNLFQQWSSFNALGRDFLNREARINADARDVQLYNAVYEAFVRWDTLQDIAGAPGLVLDENTPKCSAEVQEGIVHVLRVIETIVYESIQPGNYQLYHKQEHEYMRPPNYFKDWKSTQKTMEAKSDL